MRGVVVMSMMGMAFNILKGGLGVISRMVGISK